MSVKGYCSVCHEPLGREGYGACRSCKATARRGVYRDGLQLAFRAWTEADPERAARVALYALRASAGLPLFGPPAG